MRNIRYPMATLAWLALFATAAAQAHPSALPTDNNALMAGLSHPLLGWDHLAAALAVGLWAAWQRGQTLWTLPVVFLGAVAVGSVAGHSGVTLPFAQAGSSSSLLLLGLLLAFAARPPLVASVSMVALFAIFHGYAHGMQMPQGASALVYGLSLSLSTAALLALGVGLGRISWGRTSARLLRWTGGVLAAVGILSWV